MGESLLGYLMGKCDCDKDENGFWQLKCCKGKCSSCKKKRLQRNEIPGIQTDTTKIKFYHLKKQKHHIFARRQGRQKYRKR